MVAVTAAGSREVVRRVRKSHRDAFVATAASDVTVLAMDGCATQHPAHHPQVASFSARDVMECYAKWHDSTLAAWREEADGPENCGRRYAKVGRMFHGLGDSGRGTVDKFGKALADGQMVFMFFPAENGKTVFELAMVPPFQWDLAANRDLFCLSDDHMRDLKNGTKRIDHVVAGCRTCADPTPPTGAVIGTSKERWTFLYRPTEDVRQVVQDVLGQVKAGERLVGTHFRGQFFGHHFACGCLDSKEAPNCLSNIGSVMRERKVPGFEADTRVRYFVASDMFAGLDAFRETFGAELITLPDTLPLEHSLDATAAGAKRILAEFLILSNASAILGSCGSTFTEGVNVLSGLPKAALITTGTKESRACAANRKQLDYSAFRFSRFSSLSWSHRCGCFGDESSGAGAGTCRFACAQQPQPPNCKPSDAVSPSLFQASEIHYEKPVWVPQRPSVPT